MIILMNKYLNIRCVLFVNGPAETGKDTFIKYLSEMLKQRDYRVLPIFPIEKVKKAAKLLGWDGTKDELGRQFIVDLNKAWIDSGKRYEYITNKIGEYDHFTETNTIAIIQIREPMGIIEITNWCHTNGIINQKVHIESGKAKKYSNDADMGTKGCQYDYYLKNFMTGLCQFKDYVHDFKQIFLSTIK